MKQNIIFLIGYMGSGKSTIGQLLADHLAYAFIDTDMVIETKEGMSIPSIFDQKGESYFRNLELNVLRSLENAVDTVVSTGGGMPCFNNNLNHMNRLGVTIYLEIGVEAILERIKQDESRPLLAFKNDQLKRNHIDAMLKERRPIYQMANFTVLAIKDPMTVVRNILLKIK